MEFLSRNHFETLKGIGIIAVLICHIGGYSGVTWFTPLGGIGVALFLFCSGFGLYCSYTKNGLKYYWKKKIISIYFIYFLIEFLTALIFLRDIKVVILDLLLIKPAYSYGWYMKYLFGCYLVFWLIFRFVKEEKIRIYILVILGVLSFWGLDAICGEQALSFVSGILFAIYVKNNKPNYKYGNIFSVFAIIISVVFLAAKQLPIVRQQHIYILTLFNLIIKTFAAASIIYLSYKVKIVSEICNNFFSFFGKISYCLYLIHGYLIFIISDNLFGNYLINSVIFVSITTIVAYCVYIITKRIIDTLFDICHVS